MQDMNLMLNQLISSLEDMQAIDIKTIDVRAQTTITDYMIVASGRSSRHVKAVAQNIIEAMKKKALVALSITGIEQGDWALIDFGDFIVHIMQAESRLFYNLEGLWEERLSKT